MIEVKDKIDEIWPLVFKVIGYFFPRVQTFSFCVNRKALPDFWESETLLLIKRVRTICTSVLHSERTE